jgi:UDP-2,3-diacylglucosamine hydrolase
MVNSRATQPLSTCNAPHENTVKTDIPESLLIVAGKGAYPILLARSARTQGVKRLTAVAFRGETDRAIEGAVDAVAWVTLGRLRELLEALRRADCRHAVMAGQITPTSLFRVRMDSDMVDFFKKLPVRNAETIFGGAADLLGSIGIEVLPAHRFMETHMPEAGVLTSRTPTTREQGDIELGVAVAGATSGLDIGQTVVIKEGTVLAVEAFEGTDETILRAGKLGGAGTVVVKVAKQGHDMRFDIPIVGMRTMKTLKKARVSALAVQSGRAILLEREKVISQADDLDIAVIAL